MDLPLSGWGYGPASFQLGIWTGPFPIPIVPQFAQCDVFQGYKVHLCVFEIGMLSSLHGDTFCVSIAEHQFLPLVSSNLFCYWLWS